MLTNFSRAFRGMLSAMAMALVFVMPVVQAQGPTESMIRWYSEPNEFYLFDSSEVEVMNYKSERDIRLCVDQRRHAVPLNVTYDGKTSKVRVGDCFLFEAKRVIISPAEPLDSGWDMSGTIEMAEN